MPSLGQNELILTQNIFSALRCNGNAAVLTKMHSIEPYICLWAPVHAIIRVSSNVTCCLEIAWRSGVCCFCLKWSFVLTLDKSSLNVWMSKTDLRDDVIKWEHFPRYWPFVLGILRSPGNSPKRPVTRSFDVFVDLRLDKRQSKKSRGEAGDLRRHRAHYDVTAMIYKQHSSPCSLPVI